MDKNLLAYLDNRGIKYKIHSHPAVFTVAESRALNAEIPGTFHTKNLFLKDEANNFFLVCMDARQRADLKYLKEKLQAKKKLYFASEFELKEHLKVTPGSVSIFSMVYAKKTTLVVDKQILDAERTGFHPNINTATLEIDTENLKKFLGTLKSEKIFLEL